MRKNARLNFFALLMAFVKEPGNPAGFYTKFEKQNSANQDD